MSQLFAVIRTYGPAWQSSCTLEEQPAWDAHAAFMDSLVEEGFVVVGGPLEGTLDVLLIVHSESVQEAMARFTADPWTGMDLLRISQIAPWTIRLGKWR